MIERLFRSPKTTILGLIVMVLCFLLVFLEKATLTEVGVFVMGGFSMLFLKDSDGSKDQKPNS
jgi:hypothetical protein